MLIALAIGDILAAKVSSEVKPLVKLDTYWTELPIALTVETVLDILEALFDILKNSSNFLRKSSLFAIASVIFMAVFN